MRDWRLTDMFGEYYGNALMYHSGGEYGVYYHDAIFDIALFVLAAAQGGP